MKKMYLSKMAMYERCKKFFTEHAESFPDFAVLTSKMESFSAKLAELYAAAQVQQRSTNGITANKDAKKLALIDKLVPVSRKALTWAKDNEHADFAEQFDISATRLRTFNDLDMLGLAREIGLLLNEHKTALRDYKVETEQITTVTAAISLFAGLIEANASALDAREEAGLEIARGVGKADKLLNDIDELLISEYDATDPNLVSLYKVTRKVDAPSYSHTKLKVQVLAVATGLPLEGIELRIRELNRSVLSSIEGLAEISTFRAGVYHVELIRNNEVVYIETLRFKSGRAVELEMKV